MLMMKPPQNPVDIAYPLIHATFPGFKLWIESPGAGDGLWTTFLSRSLPWLSRASPRVVHRPTLRLRRPYTLNSGPACPSLRASAVGLDQVAHLLARMQHRRVVATAKGIADFRQAVRRQFLGQRHRHLARSRQRTIALLDSRSPFEPCNSPPRSSGCWIDEIRLLAHAADRAAFLRKIDGDRRPVNCACAISVFSAPSSSRTFERIRFAMKNATSSGARHRAPVPC
jgi:hypothetical protein